MPRTTIAICVIAFASVVVSQEMPDRKPPANAVVQLPKASLWGHYAFQFSPGGENGPYHWRIVSGLLPRGVTLHEDGRLNGDVNEQGEASFAVVEVDRSGKQEIQRYSLATETPLQVDWEKHAQINGDRIDGSIKVSNTSGRNFDLTFIVLAVNGIGRATAIGYQHFPLKPNTQGQELPFGDTLSPGNYTLNVDVVGEEPQSKMIFRARLVAARMEINAGP